MGYSAGIGLMNIWIDDLVPCLKDNETGDLKETFVYRIQSNSFLKRRHKKSGRCIVLNGSDKKKLPRFLEDCPIPEGYYEPVNPYEKHPRCPYNLKELMKYAVASGRKIKDMSREEIDQFAV